TNDLASACQLAGFFQRGAQLLDAAAHERDHRVYLSLRIHVGLLPNPAEPRTLAHPNEPLLLQLLGRLGVQRADARIRILRLSRIGVAIRHGAPPSATWLTASRRPAGCARATRPASALPRPADPGRPRAGPRQCRPAGTDRSTLAPPGRHRCRARGTAPRRAK